MNRINRHISWSVIIALVLSIVCCSFAAAESAPAVLETEIESAASTEDSYAPGSQQDNSLFQPVVQDDVYLVEGIHVSAAPMTTLSAAADSEKQALAKKCNTDYGYKDLVNVLKSANMGKLYSAIDTVEEKFFLGNTDLKSAEGQYYIGEVDTTKYGLSENQVIQVYSVYRMDHPLYYWMPPNLSLSGSGTVSKILLCCDSAYAKASVREEEYKKIKNGIKVYENYCKGSSSRYTTATATLYQMAQKIDYAFTDKKEPSEELWAHSIIGVFDSKYHQVVCEGYAKAYQLLMNYFGIPNAYVLGEAQGNTGDEGALVLHAWNAVQMDDGKYYWADPTWSDVDLRDDYFGNPITDEMTSPIGNRNHIENYPYRVRYSFHLKGNSFSQTHHELTPTNVGERYLYKLPAVSSTDYVPQIKGERQSEDLVGTRGSFACQEYGYVNDNNGLSFEVVQNDGIHRCVEMHSVNHSGVLNIPAKITYNGIEYQVVGVDLGVVNWDTKTVVIDEGIKYLHSIINYENQQTESLTIPSTVEFIENPFLSSVGLKTVNVNSGNAFIASRNGVLYSADFSRLIRYPIGLTAVSYTIPSTVKRIEQNAFFNDRNLESLTIPSSVSYIGDYVFRGMKKLKKLEVPSSVNTLGEHVFMESNIQTVHISAKTSFELTTFSQANALGKVEIGNGNPCGYVYDGAIYMYPDKTKGEKSDILVSYPNGREADTVKIKDGTRILELSFMGTKHVGKVIIPANCLVDYYAFEQCGVESLDLAAGNKSIAYSNGAIFNIDKTVLYTYLGGCKKKSYAVPSTVKTIAGSAFQTNPYIESITMSDGVTDIRGSAFADCKSLKNVALSKNVAWTVDTDWSTEPPISYADIFARNQSLVTIEIPASSTRIPHFAFSECYALNNVIIPTSITSFGDGALEGTDDRALSDIYYYGTKAQWDRIDKGNTVLDGITIHYNYKKGDPVGCASDFAWKLSNDGTLTISGHGDMRTYPFEKYPWYENRSKIKRIVVEKGITSISRYAFWNLDNVKEISLPDSVVTIEKGGIADCNSLKSISLPSKMTVVGVNAFNGSGLETIVIPASVIEIKDNAFYGLPNLININVDKSNKYYSSENGVLFDKNKMTLIAYGCGRTDESYTIPSTVKTIKTNAFSYVSNNTLQRVHFPKSMERIQEYGFWNCDALTDVYYVGTSNEWDKISIADFNDPLRNASIHYNSKSIPSGDNNGDNPSPNVTTEPTPEATTTPKPSATVTQTPKPSTNIEQTQNANAKYKDVPTTGKWYSSAVSYVSSKGYMSGTGKEIFEPNSTVTRAQIAQILYAAEGKPSIKWKSVFSDVKSGKWFSNAVVWAASKGIVSGYPDGTFKPTTEITREQMVAIMYKYTQTKGFDSRQNGDLSKFADQKMVSKYAVPGVKWAVGHGIISGTKKGIEPKGKATRAQVAVILQSYDRNVRK